LAATAAAALGWTGFRLLSPECRRVIAAGGGGFSHTMKPVRALNDSALLARILVGFALAFLIGFERKLRGSPAGDRTFALIGSAAASAAAVTGQSSLQALAGIVTGVGFIGGGLILKCRDGDIRGVSTSATADISPRPGWHRPVSTRRRSRGRSSARRAVLRAGPTMRPRDCSG